MKKLPDDVFCVPVNDTFQESRHEIVFYVGAVSISLKMAVRYDGNGNSRVWFIVTEPDKSEVTYEKFDSAATAYNMLRQKIG